MLLLLFLFAFVGFFFAKKKSLLESLEIWYFLVETAYLNLLDEMLSLGAIPQKKS